MGEALRHNCDPVAPLAEEWQALMHTAKDMRRNAKNLEKANRQSEANQLRQVAKLFDEKANEIGRVVGRMKAERKRLKNKSDRDR